MRIFLTLLAVLLPTLIQAAPQLRVAVQPEKLHFSWAELSGTVVLREEPLHTDAKPSEAQELWRGEAKSGGVDLPRFDGKRDRLFAKFTVLDATSGRLWTEPKHVTDFTALPRRTTSLGSVANKKGVTCVIGEDDVVALGAGQVQENIDIGGLLDWQSAEPKMSFEFEGRKVGLRAGAVARLDASLTKKAQCGFRTTGILLNYVAKTAPRTSPLVHPLTNPAQVPAGPAAFNTATAEGHFLYRAIVHWLADRYTEDGAPHGRLAGLVIGNEVQSHWSWYHLGEVESSVLIREYSAALRAADLATRTVHADFPLFISLEHHWTMPASDNPLQGITGVEVIDGFATTARAGGDFPWNLAHHPYPENLGNPAFWNDRSAPLRLDAPRLTFHNLEVLPAFLKQPRLLFEGHVRRITLTEQGFHCPSGPQGETLQAAAFALAWKKVQALPEIEAFLYHRHVDHPHEFGLRCGLREHDGSANVVGVGRARKIWEVMQKAGTPEEDAAFAFALPVIGRKDWSDVVATKLDPPRPPRDATRAVFDFVAQRGSVKKENVLALELRRIGPPDELQEPALQQHPNAKGEGTITYHVAVPKPSAGQTAVLVFDALLNNAKSNGAGFRVRVDAREVFNRDLRGGERVPAVVDLSAVAGREVDFVFAVDPLADPSNDWATWVAPRITFRPAK